VLAAVRADRPQSHLAHRALHHLAHRRRVRGGRSYNRLLL
jgi:hypothetical protein